MTRVCVDVMGSDREPSVLLEGIAAALEADHDLEVLVAGAEEFVSPFAKAQARATALVTTEVITMSEHPANAVRQKKDASIVRAAAAVRSGDADGLFSAGSTGAVLTAATFGVGRIKGVRRPALASALPGLDGRRTVFLDMDEDLARAKVVSREISRQLKPLERQVDKARQARELTDQLSELTIQLAVDDLRQLQESYGRLSAQGNEADAAIELAQYRYDEKARELDKLQSLLEQKGLFVGDLGEQRRRMQDILGRMEADMRLLEEKGKNMVSRLSDMRMQLSSMEKQRSDVKGERATVAADLASLVAREDELRASCERLASASHGRGGARPSPRGIRRT